MEVSYDKEIIRILNSSNNKLYILLTYRENGVMNCEEHAIPNKKIRSLQEGEVYKLNEILKLYKKGIYLCIISKYHKKVSISLDMLNHIDLPVCCEN